jgi:hypothetical protein
VAVLLERQLDERRRVQVRERTAYRESSRS